MAPRPRHYLNGYDRRREQLIRRAYADPATRCWRCGLTLGDHGPHKSGAPAKWTAGHTIDGDPYSPLLPEASTCNYAAGARLSNERQQRKRNPKSRDWFA